MYGGGGRIWYIYCSESSCEISLEKFLVLFLTSGEVMTSYVVLAPALALPFNGHQLINCFLAKLLKLKL